jgi:hypothetical protein
VVERLATYMLHEMLWYRHLAMVAGVVHGWPLSSTNTILQQLIAVIVRCVEVYRARQVSI